MKKYNLPVILLRGLVLLPHNFLKLEFDRKNIDNNVIDESVLFHDNYILVVNEYDNENPNKIGILSKIENMINLPNGNTRIDIRGIRRVEIINFLNLTQTNEPLEAIVSDIEKEILLENEEQTIINKIKKELRNYIKNIPYASNDIVEIVENEKDLSKIIDIIVPNISTNKEEVLRYIDVISLKTRSEMLLEDIYKKGEMFKIERNIDLKVKQNLDDTQKEYFLREKMKLIKEELGEKAIKDDDIDQLKEKVSSLECNDSIKQKLYKEITRYENTPSISPEANITRDYIECLLSLPWGKYTIDNTNLISVKDELNASHYGLDEVKERIIEYLAVRQMSNNQKGTIICLVGPPGVGKTSLAVSIAKAINRNFVKISVNGLKDEAEIMGHRRTYVGALPGRIINSIKKAKSSNPLMLIDEIDKMGSNSHFDATTTLLNILDKEQNKYFSDNYVEEEFDLSNVMFILTANYIEDISEPLKDRLEIINISGYTEFEKIDIAKNHLLKDIVSECGLDLNFITITDEALFTIIRNYTKEAGVRELKRQIEKIIRKIITQIVVNNIKINKIVIDNNQLEKYLGKPKYKFNELSKPQVGVVNGLAYTPYGGDVLPIEVNYYKGTGKLVLTGSLGEVMKESASIALDYLKSNYKDFDIKYSLITDNDIHIHVPEGAVKKDGPSAGIALTLALISSLTNRKIPKDIALTGEITLRGQVLPIGGLKEKCIGALRSGIKKIILPLDNINDLDNIPNEVKEQITFIPVKEFKEVLNNIN